jgi:ABC-2 type transport system ATP-binding protein
MNVAAAYAPLPGNLAVAQNLRFFGLLYGVKDLRACIDRLLDDFDLRQFRNVKCGVLSSGEQTRVGLEGISQPPDAAPALASWS